MTKFDAPKGVIISDLGELFFVGKLIFYDSTNYTVGGYKNILGSRKMCSYNRYKIYSRYENRFPEDSSYNRHLLYTIV